MAAHKKEMANHLFHFVMDLNSLRFFRLCGSSRIYDGSFSGKLTEGQGLTAELLRKAGFKVFSEEQLDEVKDLLERHGDEGGSE